MSTPKATPKEAEEAVITYLMAAHGLDHSGGSRLLHGQLLKVNDARAVTDPELRRLVVEYKNAVTHAAYARRPPTACDLGIKKIMGGDR